MQARHRKVEQESRQSAGDRGGDQQKRQIGREKNYPWLNVGGNRANVDYLEAYNIYETGNPAMFIIDNRTKNIILNRRIEMSSIPNFLEQYEKIEKKKAEDALKLQK